MTRYYCAKCKFQTTNEAEASKHKEECGGIIVVIRKFGTVIE